MSTLTAQIKLRRDTQANWTSSNPVLGAGEIAISSDQLHSGTDQPKFKIGDGVQTWTNLDYYPVGSGSTPTLAQVLATGALTNSLPMTGNSGVYGIRIDNSSVEITTDSFNQATSFLYLTSAVANLFHANGRNTINNSSHTITHDTIVVLDTPLIELSQETASRLAIIDASKNLKSANTATYPDLTELSYVKGVTSNIQTQLNKTRIMYMSSGSNQTTTSNVLANITDLVISLEANSVYSIEGVIRAGCNNTGGYFLAADVPTSSTFNFSLIGQATSLTAFQHQMLDADATAHGTAFNRINNAFGLRINGTIRTDSTSGNLQFMFASGTNTQTSTIYVYGTYIKITKIA